ncbi:MAG: hypothetical protein WAN62_05285, partial [Candidatus Acidiferrum sp.]
RVRLMMRSMVMSGFMVIPKFMGASRKWRVESRKKKKEKDFTLRTQRHREHREEKADSPLRSE